MNVIACSVKIIAIPTILDRLSMKFVSPKDILKQICSFLSVFICVQILVPIILIASNSTIRQSMKIGKNEASFTAWKKALRHYIAEQLKDVKDTTEEDEFNRRAWQRALTSIDYFQRAYFKQRLAQLTRAINVSGLGSIDSVVYVYEISSGEVVALQHYLFIMASDSCIERSIVFSEGGKPIEGGYCLFENRNTNEVRKNVAAMTDVAPPSPNAEYIDRKYLKIVTTYYKKGTYTVAVSCLRVQFHSE